MIRKAFKMKVFPGKTQVYSERHSPIWPELEKTLKQHGVHNYNIFLDKETHILFAFVEIESEERWKAIADTAICKKWWTHMADLMETNADDSPVSQELERVFYLP